LLPSGCVVCCGGLLLGIEGAEVLLSPIVPYPRFPSIAVCSHTVEAGLCSWALQPTATCTTLRCSCCRCHCLGLLQAPVVAHCKLTMVLPSGSVICCGGLLLGIEGAEVVINYAHRTLSALAIDCRSQSHRRSRTSLLVFYRLTNLHACFAPS
jgi:hypothetical protein